MVKFDDFRRWSLSWIFLLSASSKIAFWDGWQNYIAKDLSQISKYFAYALYVGPVAEMLLGLLLLTGKASKWTLGTSGVLSVLFGGYHYLALQSDGNAPCSCFGPVLSMSHQSMFLLSLAMAGLSFVSGERWGRLATRYFKEPAKARLGMHLAVLPFVPALLYHISAIGLAPNYRETILADSPTLSEYLAQATTVYFSKSKEISDGTYLAPTGIQPTKNTGIRYYAFVDVTCPYSQRLLAEVAGLSGRDRENFRLILHPVLRKGQFDKTDITKLFAYVSAQNPVAGPSRPGYRSLTILSEGRVPLVVATIGSKIYKIESSSSLKDSIKDFSLAHS